MGKVAAVWGLLGVCALLLHAVLRLSPRAAEAVTTGLTPVQWAILIGWVGFMAYSEGYRGFHLRFSPMVVARARWLAQHPTAIRLLLAPAFCMGLFHATRKRLIISWSLIAGIALLVVVVSLLPAPWRGIVDAGVVVGLFLGLTSIGYHAVRALLGTPPSVSEDLPREVAA